MPTKCFLVVISRSIQNWVTSILEPKSEWKSWIRQSTPTWRTRTRSRGRLHVQVIILVSRGKHEPWTSQDISLQSLCCKLHISVMLSDICWVFWSPNSSAILFMIRLGSSHFWRENSLVTRLFSAFNMAACLKRYLHICEFISGHISVFMKYLGKLSCRKISFVYWPWTDGDTLKEFVRKTQKLSPVLASFFFSHYTCTTAT